MNLIGQEDDNDKDFEIVKREFNLKETSWEGSYNLAKSCRATLDEIIMMLNIREESLYDIRRGNRKQCLTPIKLEIIKSGLGECYSLKEIAEYLNAAPSTISKLISRNKIV